MFSKKLKRQSKKNLYIDIDGVILTKGTIPAPHIDIFIKYILKKYSVFWLSSRCSGDNKKTLKYLNKFFAKETVKLLKKIKPTSYHIDKTEAIDFSKKFFWLDNEIFESEKNKLLEESKFDSWIKVNLIKNPNQLLYFVSDKSNI